MNEIVCPNCKTQKFVRRHNDIFICPRVCSTFIITKEAYRYIQRIFEGPAWDALPTRFWKIRATEVRWIKDGVEL